MARRRRSYRKSYSYGSRGRSRRRSYAPRRRSSYGARRGGNTIRLQLMNPQAPRPPFGTFTPSAMGPFGMLGMAQGGGSMAPGAPPVQQGGPGVPGARMIINPIQRAPTGFQVPPGYVLVPESEVAEA